MNHAPNTTPTGSTRRWSDPTMSRTMCGTTRPTNPITPLTATATPASSEVAKNRFRRSRATSTPRDAAGSAPMASAFSARPCPSR